MGKSNPFNSSRVYFQVLFAPKSITSFFGRMRQPGGRTINEVFHIDVVNGFIVKDTFISFS
jgi:hypothetical protein